MSQHMCVAANQNLLVFNSECLIRSPIDLVFPFVQSVEMQKTARRKRQTVLVGGIGLEPTTSSL